MSETIKKMESTAKTHLNNIMQIVVFNLNDGNHYGINVSKVRSFEDFKRYRVIKNNTVKSPILTGYIQYHEKVVPVLDIEMWLDIHKAEGEYKEFMICEFNQQMVAFPIAGIQNIYNVPIGDLQKPEQMVDVVTYNSIINIEGEEIICLVLDVEKILFDAFGETYELGDEVQHIETKKVVLVAEDSHTAQAIIDEILKTTDVSYKIFNDGEEIINYINGLDEAGIGSIGMVFTDLEMPRRDGYQVIRHIKENPKTQHIPIVVNTSMSNKGVDVKTKGLGVSAFVAKTDPEKFLAAMRENMLP